MRVGRILVVVAGLAVGAAAGVGLLYVNPMTAPSSSELEAFDRVLSYDFPSEDVLILTHAGTAPVPTHPVGVTELWESSIRAALTGVVVVGEGDAQPYAVATKIAVPSVRTDLLRAGVVVDDNWLLTVPGEGSLLVLGHSNVWPAIKDNLLPVRMLRRPWHGPRSYRTTYGPGVRGTALVVGATGRFESLEGNAVERFEVTGFSREGGFEKFAGEIHLRLIDDAPTEAADARAEK